MASDLASLLKAVEDLWLKQFEACRKHKKAEFGDTAERIMKFVGRRYNPGTIKMQLDGVPIELADNDSPFATVLNWTQCFVDVMAPYIYAQVPNRLCSPIRPPLPPEIAQLRPDIAGMQKAKRLKDRMICFEQQWFLNWTPLITDAKTEGRMVVQEALAKGRGTAWLEMGDSPIRNKKDGTLYQIPTMRADSVDCLFIDADAKHIRDAGYIYRQREMSAYRVAALWGEDAEDIRSKAKISRSSQEQSVLTDQGTEGNRSGDLVMYYEVWSRVGMGQALVWADKDMKENPVFAAALEEVGPFCHFAIMPGMGRPLGLDPAKLTALATQNTAPVSKPDEGAEPPTDAAQGNLESATLVDVLTKALEWPVKTYGNPAYPWPVACLDFKPRVDCSWPKAILEDALSLQEFLDRVYDLIMRRVHKAGRDVCIYNTAIAEDILTALRGTDDLAMVPFNGPVTKEAVEGLLHIFTFPVMNKDIFEVLRVVAETFREITGLDPGVLGQIPRTQDRSAKASSMRESGLTRRPDDYAEAVESWASLCSNMEGVAARMTVDAEVLAELFGERDVPRLPNDQPNYANMPLTAFWLGMEFAQDGQVTQVTTIHTDDEYVAAAGILYEVQAGSGKRKNLQLQQQNATQMYTMFGQQAFTLALDPVQGSVEPLAILTALVGEAYQMTEMQTYIDSLTAALARMGQQGAIGGPPMPAKGNAKPAAAGGGGTPAEELAKVPGGNRLVGAWAKAAGGPRGGAVPPAPETA